MKQSILFQVLACGLCSNTVSTNALEAISPPICDNNTYIGHVLAKTESPSAGHNALTDRSELEIANISTLRNVAVRDGLIYNVKGYTTPGDGGGGTFVGVASSTAIDDGGSVIVPKAGLGRFVRKVTSVVDLRAFGADPTAARNSRNQFQYALNWCAAKGAELVVTGNIRVASTIPLAADGVTIRWCGGVIWNSLPDNYNWTAYEWDAPSFPGQVQQNGATATFTPKRPAGTNFPWNGKTNMFDLANCILINPNVDGGWWYSPPQNLPPGYPKALSIRGVSQVAYPEMTYYQMFSPSSNVLIEGPGTLANSPGAYLESSSNANISVTWITFGEFGDHVLYVGGGGSNLTFNNNTVIAARPGAGVPGSRNYIFPTHRECVKYRGVSNATIVGNTFNAPNAIFSDLESSSETGQASDTNNVVISGNTVNCRNFLNIRSARYAFGTTPATNDGSGFFVRNIAVSGNTAVVHSAFMVMDGAIVNLNIFGNKITSTTANSTLFSVMPSICYKNPVQGFNIIGNEMKMVNGSLVQVIGNGGLFGPGNMTIASNRVCWSLPTTWNSILGVDCGQSVELEQLSINRNVAVGAWSLIVGGGMNKWMATKTYYGNRQAFADGFIAHGDIVYYAGSFYQASQPITGSSSNPNPSADTKRWRGYALPTPVINLIGNTEEYSNGTYVTYLIVDPLPFMPRYNAQHNLIMASSGNPAYILSFGRGLEIEQGAPR
jgi:hypothetical protein